MECQRRQIGAFLQVSLNSPPPLQRKRPIPLPLATPTSLLLDTFSGEESVSVKRENRAICNLPSRNSTDLISSPWKIPSQIDIDSSMTPSVRQQSPSEPSTQKPSQLPRQRPLLRITIPETERSIPWLDKGLCDSPLVCIIELP